MTCSTAQPPPAMEAHIDSLRHDGRGAARVEGKVVFIDNALPGEHVRYRPARRQRRYDTGSTVEILSVAPERVSPRCEYFGVCGGCVIQHLAPEAQVRHKESWLLESLERTGGVVPERLLAPLSGSDWGYRRKARLGVRYVPKKGGVLVGFRERRRSFVTPLARCPVLHATISALLPDLATMIASLSCYDQLPQVEVAVGDNASALVFRHLKPLMEKDMGRLERFGRDHRVQIFLQPGNLESVRPAWPIKPEILHYTLPEQDLVLRFQPTDFIQVNGMLNRRLVNLVIDLLRPKSDEDVLDLYCGLGNFSLPLARFAREVVGAEAVPALVQRARDNAAYNELHNVKFLCADLNEADVEGIWSRQRYPKMLLDPPRSGAMEVIKHVPQITPRRIVYVSCNPTTLARDTQLLVNKFGFRLAAVGIVDMFPHTAHIESIAVYEPN